MREMITTNLPVFIIIAPLFVSFILPTLSKRIKLVENLVISVEILGIALWFIWYQSYWPREGCL